METNNDGKCPVCGKKIITENGTASKLCKHVQFIYLQSVGEFEMCKDETISEKISQCLAMGEVDEAETLLPKGWHIEDYTESGMCCGPCSFTIYIGIKKK